MQVVKPLRLVVRLPSTYGCNWNIDSLKQMDVIITCQGGDYTTEVFPKLKAENWNGYWIDAASTLRMDDEAIIVLDPVNMNCSQRRLSERHKNIRGR